MNRIALVATSVLIAAPLVPVFAQTPAPPAKPAKPAPRPAPSLDFLRHDPQTQGVLLFITNRNEQFGLPAPRRIVTTNGEAATITDTPKEAEPPKRTPAQFAETIKRRVAISGNLSAIVPLTMAVLAKNPPPADPYSDMAFDERFMLMLGKFSRAQWMQASSENGIGLGDMTPEQREIYAGLWGEEGATVDTYRSLPRKEGQRYRQTENVKKETFNANEVRFRFSRRVSFTFEDLVKKRSYGGGTVNYEPPIEPEADGSTLRQSFSQPGGGYRRFSEEGESKAYGVTLVRYVPNTLKPGDLPLDAPALSATVVLDGSQKTVGDLLAAASKATGIELRADRRLANLPALTKTVPGGQSVEAGHLLKLICRSTTSTFRHLRGANASDRGVYLLTDDREGLGTRLARLDEWATDAYEKRRKILSDAADACAENEPLDVLGFIPGDKYALSPDLIKASDAVLREKNSWGEGLKISPTKLSPDLREKMEEQLKGLNEYGSSAKVRTDQIEVKTEFHCDWVLPGKRTFSAQFYGEMGWGMLDKIALPKAKRPKYADRVKRDHPEPTGFPKNLKRRVLVAPLPADDAGTLTLMQSARAKGFGEIWLQVESDGEETRTRLQSAVATGKTLALPVGAVLPWTLKKPDGEGATVAEDINILGETGTQVWAGLKKRPEPADETDAASREYRTAMMREQQARTVGWIVPDATLAARRIAPFLAIPGLCGVVLESTAPPGYTGSPYVFGATGEQSAMGYTPALRLGCVRATNIDPVDVAGYGFRLGNTPRLPFFSDSYSVMAPIADYRLTQNKAFMASLWEALRPAPTGTPIYLDSRTEYSQYPFYARWSDPKRVPNVSANTYEEAPVRTAAFKASAEPLLASRGIPWVSSTGYFWDKWYKDTRSAATTWRGFVVDLRYQSPEQIAGFLKQLPDDTAPAVPVKGAGVPKKP